MIRPPVEENLDWSAAWKVALETPDWYSSHSTLGRMMRDYEAQVGIGKTILDIGCGPRPVSDVLAQRYKRVLVDIVPEVRQLTKSSDSPIAVQIDINKVAHGIQPDHYVFSQAMRNVSPDGNVDCILAGQVLNYLDYRPVLKTLNGVLKQDGVLGIAHTPLAGLHQHFHEGRPKDADSLIKFLIHDLNYGLRGYHPIWRAMDCHAMVFEKSGRPRPLKGAKR